ncbi:hypothetical protein [Nitrosospira multiformis]|uniref:Uncharacterized protein n=1 Tax=Nitrosospira multiformis TaxID=1231 RepID=A0A1I7IVH6_9PROT|nr:hypothetical protein [Nitrosospira multiformis]SFU76957.1 hypothetical protein SAMN05216417_12818 [Nitrosospira multiformis]
MQYRKKSGREKTWTFMYRAEDNTPAEEGSTSPHIPAFRIVLKGEDGKPITVSEKDFLDNYEASSSIRDSMENEAIKETLALIRTQSTIRFAALPFFLTALAVLANASHNKNGGFTDMAGTISLVGAGLSLIAIVIEIVISRNLIVWWKAIRTETKNTDWKIVYAHRNNGALKSARTALIVPYLAALFYWIFELWNMWASSLIVLFIFVFAGYIWAKAEPEGSVQETSKRSVS